MDSLAIHRESGAFWDSISDWYGERDEAKSIQFPKTAGQYRFKNERKLPADCNAMQIKVL